MLARMQRLKICLTFVACLLPPLGPARAAGQPDLSADCYGPTKPLTPELRAAFVSEIRPLATKAERDYGIPAAIFAAMAIHESGYGTTRLAIATNNLLSYKWPGPPGPDGRAVYELSCQPRQDEGRIYVVSRPCGCRRFRCQPPRGLALLQSGDGEVPRGPNGGKGWKGRSDRLVQDDRADIQPLPH